MALYDADSAGRIRLHVRIDERTAGFLALGLARGSGHPAIVVTTSGTAVANLHPAVLEAHHGGVPLLVLSADRPPNLRDVGANQTIDQRALFGPALRFFHEFGVAGEQRGQNALWRSMVCRALAHSRGAGTGLAGPVQLNVPFAEPLLPDDSDAAWSESLQGRHSPSGDATEWTMIDTPGGFRSATGLGDGNTIAAPADGENVLYVGDLTHSAAGHLAALGHLVISESGGAAGADVISAGLHLLAVPEFLSKAKPDRVVVLGRPTLYRQVSALLADPTIAVEVLAPIVGYPDPAGTARRVAPALAPVGRGQDSDFAALWRQAQTVAAEQVSLVVGEMNLGNSPRLAAAVVAHSPERSNLVLGSSQGPRDVGLAAAPRNGLRVLANRGVAGIDGTVSTAAGVALGAHPDSGPTVALMGDLTFLHDMTGLVIGPHEPRPDLIMVVSNNGGGGIFHTLESGEPLHARAFERVFGTSHDVRLAFLAQANGWEHLLVRDESELAGALAAPSGIQIVEVRTGRTDLRELHHRIRSAVAGALA